MDDIPVLGMLSSPEDDMVPDLFGAEGHFASETMALTAPAAIKREVDDFHIFQDAYLGAADPKETLPRILSAPPGADCKVKVELEDPRDDQGVLPEHPGLAELSPLEDALLTRAPAPAYNVHFLSSLLASHRSPAVLPLGAWPREGAAHPGLRMIPVEIKEAGGPINSNNPEEATFPNLLPQESCCKFPPSLEQEGHSDYPLKDPNPMVICPLKGGTRMLCVDPTGPGGLKALHLVPRYQDQNDCLQSDVPKPMTTLVGRFLPVPAKLNLITQQLEKGPLPPLVNGSALPGPPKLTLAGVTLSSWDTKSKKPCNCTKSQCLKLYCDCFASGDFCYNCNCSNCCNNLRHELDRFKAVKACLDRNPEAFQPKIGKLGDVRPRHNRGCNCRRSGCLKNYCECYEAKIMCSSICKCIGCQNYEESPERQALTSPPASVEARGMDNSHLLSPAKFSVLPKSRKDRPSFTCISWEVVEATCACLLAQGEEAEKERCSPCLAEQRILEEFGRCLSQILHLEFKSRGLTLE